MTVREVNAQCSMFHRTQKQDVRGKLCHSEQSSFPLDFTIWHHGVLLYLCRLLKLSLSGHAVQAPHRKANVSCIVKKATVVLGSRFRSESDLMEFRTVGHWQLLLHQVHLQHRQVTLLPPWKNVGCALETLFSSRLFSRMPSIGSVAFLHTHPLIMHNS